MPRRGWVGNRFIGSLPVTDGRRGGGVVPTCGRRGTPMSPHQGSNPPSHPVARRLALVVVLLLVVPTLVPLVAVAAPRPMTPPFPNIDPSIPHRRVLDDRAVAAPAVPQPPLQQVRPAAAPPLQPLAVDEQVLVLLIEFQDTVHQAAHDGAYFDDLVFDQGVGATSVWRFYDENSYGTFHIAGGVDGTWYTAAGTEAHYGTHELEAFPPVGFENSQDLVLEAILAADANGMDFSDYDSDGDGVVDHLIVVHAGAADENDGDGTGPSNDPQIWSHRWALNGQALVRDGVWLNAYTMQSEFSPMGIFAHEFGHDLGLIDYYDTDYNSDGVGNFDIMSGGSWLDNGNTPAHLSALCKVLLGFLTPTNLVSAQDGVVVPRVEDSATAYRIWIDAPTEYFLVENRQKVGFDSFLPGSGLLIWHVNLSAPTNSVNAFRQLDLEEASGPQHLDNAGDGNYGDAADFWANTAPGVGFTPLSVPNSHADDGTDSTVVIDNISVSGISMTFDFGLGNTAPNVPTLQAPAAALATNDNTPTFQLKTTDFNLDPLRFRIELSTNGFATIAYAYDQTLVPAGWDAASYSNDQIASFTPTSAIADALYQWRARAYDGADWSVVTTGRSLRIDTTAPSSLSIQADSGATFTTDLTVAIALSAADGGSGMADFALSNDGVAWGGWAAYVPATTWDVSGGDGAKTVFLRVRDIAGNIASGATDGIILDGTAPAGVSIVVEGGVPRTADPIVNASLAAADALSGLDSFTTSLDGFTWDPWLPWVTTTSFNLTGMTDGPYTFSLRVRDIAGNVAPTASAVLTLDTTPPENLTIIIDSGATSTSDRSVNLTLDADDTSSSVADMAFSFDGIVWQAWQPYATSASVVLPDVEGRATVYFRVRDTLGNLADPVSASILYDRSPPLVLSVAFFDPVDGSARDAFNGSALQLRVVALDQHSGLEVIVLRPLWGAADMILPYSAMSAVTFPEGSLPAADGQVQLLVIVRDAAGNEASQLLTLTFDTVAPELQPGAVLASATDTLPLPLVVSDTGSGAAGVRYAVGLGAWSAWQAYDEDLPITLPQAEGSYQLQLEVRDGAGNVQATTLTVWRDQTPPQILSYVDFLGFGGTNGTTLQVELDAADFDTTGTSPGSGLAEVRTSEGGIIWSPWDPAVAASPGPWRLSVSLSGIEGPTTVYLQVRDHAGSVATVSKVFWVDTLPPVGTFATGPGGLFAPGPVVSMRLQTAEDPTQLYFRLSDDGSTFGPWVRGDSQQVWELQGTGPSHQVVSQLRDRGGNIVTRTLEVLVDEDAPEHLTLVGSGGGFIQGVPFDLLLQGTDPSGIYAAAALLGSADQPPLLVLGDPQAELHLLHVDGPVQSSGSVDVRLWVEDGAGNIARYDLQLAIDHTPPLLAVRDVPVAVNDGNVSFTVDVEDDQSTTDQCAVAWSLDGVLWSTWLPAQGEIHLEMGPTAGPRAFYVHAIDAAGNIGAAVTLSVLVDDRAPQVLSVVLGDGSGGSPTATVDVGLTVLETGSGLDAVRFSEEGGAFGEWQPYQPRLRYTFATGSGTVHLRVQVRDAAGNVGVGEAAPLSIGADSRSIVVTSPTSGQSISGRVRVSGVVRGLEVTSVEVRVDGGAWRQATGTSTFTFDIDTTSLHDGSHLIEARAIGAAATITTGAILVTVANEPERANSPGIAGLTDLSVLLPLLIALVALFIAVAALTRRGRPPATDFFKDGPRPDAPSTSDTEWGPSGGQSYETGDRGREARRPNPPSYDAYADPSGENYHEQGLGGYDPRPSSAPAPRPQRPAPSNPRPQRAAQPSRPVARGPPVAPSRPVAQRQAPAAAPAQYTAPVPKATAKPAQRPPRKGEEKDDLQW